MQQSTQVLDNAQSYLGIGIPDPRTMGVAVKSDPRTRILTGSGTPFLRLEHTRADGKLERVVHGQNANGTMKGVYEVRVDGQRLPEVERRSYPLNATSTHPAFSAMPTPGGAGYKEIAHPIYAVDIDADGVALIARSVLSNDGIWSPHSTISVTADWEVVEDAPAPVAKKN